MNKGKIVGQKAPFKLKDIWTLRVRLQMASRVRELALFNLGIDSKLRGCDLVKLKVRDVCHGDRVAARAIVMQQKTQRPVQFEITQPTRHAPGMDQASRGPVRHHSVHWTEVTSSSLPAPRQPLEMTTTVPLLIGPSLPLT